MARRISLKVLDSDRFFYDSPDPGEPTCICSRCGRYILQGEALMRIAVSADSLGEEKGESIHNVSSGAEFRMCEDCVSKHMPPINTSQCSHN